MFWRLALTTASTNAELNQSRSSVENENPDQIKIKHHNKHSFRVNVGIVESKFAVPFNSHLSHSPVPERWEAAGDWQSLVSVLDIGGEVIGDGDATGRKS